MSMLERRHAFVTGGGTGIGAAIARALAGEGAHVTITGRRQTPLDEVAAGSSAISTLLMDVTDEDQVRDRFHRAVESSGPVDILVANAGIAETLPIAKMDLAFWRRTMSTNLDGAFLAMQAVLPGMVESGWGRIIAIASIAGQTGFPRGSAYCASKHGMIGLCRALAAETATTGVTVNALCPGYVRTPIVDRSVDNIIAKTGMDADKALDALVSSNPNGRLIEPEEVASAALYLCRDDAGGISGQSLQIAGGLV